jgi:hypothetical protein
MKLLLKIKKKNIKLKKYLLYTRTLRLIKLSTLLNKKNTLN